jgi:hypothetical protein
VVTDVYVTATDSPDGSEAVIEVSKRSVDAEVEEWGLADSQSHLGPTVVGTRQCRVPISPIADKSWCFRLAV